MTYTYSAYRSAILDTAEAVYWRGALDNAMTAIVDQVANEMAPEDPRRFRQAVIRRWHAMEAGKRGAGDAPMYAERAA